MTPLFLRTRSTRSMLLVLTLALLVHAPGGLPNVVAAGAERKAAAPSTAAPKGTPRTPLGDASAGIAPLPQPAAEMREAILTAVHLGSIDELKVPLEWNEMKPDLGLDRNGDPIEYWRKLSGDGEGREILAVLGRILEMRHAVEPVGKDFENNQVFVWPYLALADLSKLSPAEEVDLYRLVSPAEAKVMRDKKRWTWWRLSIGADGTWHSFVRD